MGLVGIYKSLFSTSEVVLSDESMTVPHAFPLSKKVINIKYSDIQKLEIRKVNRIRFLQITHAKGKASISDSMLPQKQHLDEIMQIVQSKMN